MNIFYACFNANTANILATASICANATKMYSSTGEVCTLTVSQHDIWKTLRLVKERKSVGPDGIPRQVLKTCSDQLAPVLTNISKLSLAQSVVSPCFKRFTKFQHDKVTGCGLQNGTMEDMHSSYDQQNPVGKSVQLQVIWYTLARTCHGLCTLQLHYERQDDVFWWKFNISSAIQTSYYTTTTESIVTGIITTW